MAAKLSDLAIGFRSEISCPDLENSMGNADLLRFQFG
jgi:hypothetical protein